MHMTAKGIPHLWPKCQEASAFRVECRVRGTAAVCSRFDDQSVYDLSTKLGFHVENVQVACHRSG